MTQATNQAINQSIKQPIDYSIYQSINQTPITSINQSINGVLLWLLLLGHARYRGRESVVQEGGRAGSEALPDVAGVGDARVAAWSSLRSQV